MSCQLENLNVLSLVMLKIQRKSGKAKKVTTKFTIDCSTPVEDEIMDVASFVSHCPIICLYFWIGVVIIHRKHVYDVPFYNVVKLHRSLLPCFCYLLYFARTCGCM